jgi:hypothetical protein
MMMKRTMFVVLFAALVVGGMSAEDGGVKRSVLFTLGENEEIWGGEYFVLQQMDQDRFACITWDTVKRTGTFVFNGRRIATGEWPHVLYLNVHEENGYVVEYYFQGKDYVNIKGKVYGLFEYPPVFADDSYSLFYYYTNYHSNYYIRSNGVEDGPFEEIRFPKKAGMYAGSEYLYLLAGKWYAHYGDGRNKMVSMLDVKYEYLDGKYYVTINGKRSEGYEYVGYLNLTESGKYAYEYKENGKYYVTINGERSGGYDYVGNLELTESGKYAYFYIENENWYRNINGMRSRLPDSIDYVDLFYFTESGKYAYIYSENENDKEHANINGVAGRGYDYIGRSLFHLEESGKYAYTYEENGKWHVNINGKESDGYGYRMADNGDFSFYYAGDDGKLYENRNGVKMETEYFSGMRNGDRGGFALFGNAHSDGWNQKESVEIYSSDREHSFYSSYKYDYVVIDGKRRGAAPALYAWYERGRNAFVWNAVEGRELVVYEYKL